MKISRVGLGCSANFSNDKLSKKEQIATIRSAIDHGVNFFNTADFYGAGNSEMNIGEAIRGYDRDYIYLSVKFGALMAPSGAMYGLDVTPFRIKNYLTHTLKRLNVDYIDLYQPARLDLGIPIEETIGEISRLVEQGYVREIGVTQVDEESLRKAHLVHPIRFVESEYSLFNRDIEQTIIPTARELGIDVVAFGVLAHGLLTENWTKERVERTKSFVPLFAKDNIVNNIELVQRLEPIASEKNITVSQLAYAWALSKDRNILPLIGTSKLKRFEDSLKALDVQLTTDEIKKIESLIPKSEIKGDSFPQRKFENGIVVE